MSLLSEAMTQCRFIVPERVADGLGGYSTEYRDGAVFSAAIVRNNSVEARVAQKQGVTDVYTVTTEKALDLRYHEIFRRSEDGKIFRVTSDGDDNKTPQSAGLNMRQVSAEEWALPRI